MQVSLDEDAYRQYSHMAETPAVGAAHPDQWVDWGGVTVTVDPPLNKQWIHDSHDGHRKSADRGRFYDAARVRELKNWEETHTYSLPVGFEPSVAQVNGLDTFSEPSGTRGCRQWRGAVRDATNFGKWPAISQLWRTGQLAEKSTGQIEAEMREAERTRTARIYV